MAAASRLSACAAFAGACALLCGWAIYRVANPTDSADVDAPDADAIARMPPSTNDCGAAALYCVCRLGGKRYTLDALRELTATSERGTTMWHVKYAASTVGFQTTAIRGSFRQLLGHVSRDGSFAVLYLRNDHFVAAVGNAGGGLVRIVDSSRGVLDVNEARLRNELGWTGIAILLASQ